jgi:two-component system sensor histidine kinase CiaH
MNHLHAFWAALRKATSSTTSRLALTYLMIIMVMSVGFSIVFYNTSYHELGRQIPPPHSNYTNDYRTNVAPQDAGNGTQPTSLNGFLHQRISEGRHNLLMELIALNIGALVLGSIVSYQLARRTLEPIEAAMEAQAQFVSDASHELRTPLTAIQASNEVALRKTSLTLAQAKEVIRNNTEDALRLQELSEGLLRLARQKNQVLELEPVSLQTAAGDAMNHIVKIATLKQIAVEDNVPDIAVLGDKSGLTQIAAILLDNAIKYSHEMGTIYLEGQQKGKFGYLTVRDEGIGIPEAELPHVFQRFYRVDTARTQGDRPGYGLGLSIAKKLILQQRGDLTVASELGKGSSFTIRLPLA